MLYPEGEFITYFIALIKDAIEEAFGKEMIKELIAETKEPR